MNKTLSHLDFSEFAETLTVMQQLISSSPVALSSRSTVSTFYDSCRKIDIPGAIEQLIRFNSKSECKAMISHLRQCIGHESGVVCSKCKILPMNSGDPDPYLQCLELYRLGKYTNAYEMSHKIIHFNRYNLPTSIVETLELGSRHFERQGLPWISRFLGKIILLHTAILYRLGHGEQAHHVFDLLSKFPSAISDVARFNRDLCGPTHTSIPSDAQSFPDYVKSNELVLLAQQGSLTEMKPYLARLTNAEFTFKGPVEDLEYLQSLVGFDSDGAQGSLLLKARTQFAKRDWKKTIQILCLARERFRVLSSSIQRIINYNHALVCMCAGDYDDALKIYERTGVDGAPASVLVSYCTCMIMTESTQRAVEFVESLPPKQVAVVNLGLAHLYCCQDNWEFGLLRLVESDGDWYQTKQIILAFLINVGKGHVRCDHFEDWNNVIERLVNFLTRNKHEEANILLTLVKKLMLPTVAT